MFGLIIKCVFAGSFVGDEELINQCCSSNIALLSVVSLTYWCGYNFSEDAKNKTGRNNKVNRV